MTAIKMKLPKTKVIISVVLTAFLCLPESAIGAAIPPTINFPVCTSLNETNCIDSVGEENSDGSISWGTRVANSSFEFDIPGEKFASGDGRIGFSMSWRPDGAPLCWWNSCDYHAGSIDMVIFPTGTYSQTTAGLINFDESNQMQCGTVAAPTYCGKWWNFGKDLRFIFKFRAKGFNVGMISGRAKNVDFEDLNKNAPSSESHIYQVKASNIISDSYVINEIRDKAPADRIKADFYSDGLIMWFWDENNSATTRLPEKCNSKNVAGSPTQLLFNTFNMGAPSWNALDSTLSVQLESAHLAYDGNVNKGFYEMVFSKATATCLWGINPSVNAKAEVSISYSDGQVASIATVSQEYKDEKLRITAANFHLSKPTISTRILEETKVSETKVVQKTEEVVQSPPVQQSVKKLSIVCVKGKLTKKITAVNPKCPAGYKKK
jgi:hypothetical protein